MADFARWIASTSPVIYVGHCDDVQCFYCDGGRCPVCGKTGPCGFADDGTPLICATRP